MFEFDLVPLDSMEFWGLVRIDVVRIVWLGGRFTAFQVCKRQKSEVNLASDFGKCRVTALGAGEGSREGGII